VYSSRNVFESKASIMSAINRNSGGYPSYGPGSQDSTDANSQPSTSGNCPSSSATTSGDIVDYANFSTVTDEAQPDPSGFQGMSVSALIEILQALIALLMQMFGNSPGQNEASSKQSFAPVKMAASSGGGGASSAGGAAPTASTPSTASTASTAGAPTGGFANDWHTVRFSNTTNEPIVVRLTMGFGDTLPPGVRKINNLEGEFTIPPGQATDITFAPGSKPNFRSTKGDGSVWNQGEMTFDEAHKEIYFDMSYIYGANSNMRMYSSDGKHSGYQGDVLAAAPGAAKVGNWGISAPYNRTLNSNDPKNPDSAAGGPNGAKNAGAAYLYSILQKGEGYVGRGLPVEVTDYDDASTLKTSGKVSVVF
jgi:hypothetical protein